MDPSDKLNQQAIDAALKQNWKHAIDLNLTILDDNSKDIATINRLAFAYTQLGKIKRAKASYQKVLNLDKYNPIAKKGLDRLATLKSGQKIKNAGSEARFFTSFIEEPGKTKTVNLVRPASSKTLFTISSGSPVKLVPKKKRLSVETKTNEYIGCLPDDVGFRLSSLIKNGYQYQAFIKSNQAKTVSVFIREVSRSQQAQNLPSFPVTNQTTTKIPKPQALDEIPIDLTPTGEEDNQDD